jgi:predicted phage replisome organizer
MSLSFIKLDINIMNDSKIKQIRKMPAGSDMVVLWVGLLCLGMRSGRSGIVEIGDNIPYDADMLSVEFDIEKRTVELALNIFKKFNMIDVFENGAILLCNFEKHQELEKIEKQKENQRERVKRFREKKRNLLPPPKQKDLKEDVTVTQELRNTQEIKSNATDIDKDLDKDKDINIFQILFDTWNSIGFKKCRKITDKHRSAIKKIISEGYVVEDIKKSILNYGFIVGSDDHYYTHKFNFIDFLKREGACRKFIDSDPSEFKNFETVKVGQPKPKPKKVEVWTQKNEEPIASGEEISEVMNNLKKMFK